MPPAEAGDAGAALGGRPGSSPMARACPRRERESTPAASATPRGRRAASGRRVRRYAAKAAGRACGLRRCPAVAPGALAGAPRNHRPSDGALASSQLRVPGREYPCRDAGPAGHAPVMAIRFSLIPARAPARSRTGGIRPGWPRIRAGRSLPGPGPGASTSGRARRGRPSWRRPARRPWSTRPRA